ncbi:MAG: hypothetical protein LBH55_01340 [Mycoplasmataceae bacterium]|jgi:ribosomal protein S6|nr:hypothetical protein [Mycoplasmataceae bacterium]
MSEKKNRFYEAHFIVKESALTNIQQELNKELEIIKTFNNVKTIYYGLNSVAGLREKTFGVVAEAMAVPLAYEIKHEKNGVHIIYSFEIEDADKTKIESLKELKRIAYLNNSVLRVMFSNFDNQYGAAQTKNPKKAKTAEVIQAKYAKNREAFLNAKTGMVSIEDIKSSANTDSDVESFETNFTDDVVVSDEQIETVVKKKRASSKK